MAQKRDILSGRLACPLYPQWQTLIVGAGMSTLCHERTFVPIRACMQPEQQIQPEMPPTRLYQFASFKYSRKSIG
jgi:hypothetical protein